MDYQQDELELRQLLRGLETVPDTHPPIYMLNGILIGYDKLDRIAVIAAEKNTPVQTKWLEKALKVLTRSIRGSYISSRAKNVEFRTVSAKATIQSLKTISTR